MRKARSSSNARGSISADGIGVSVVPTTTRSCHGTANSTRPSEVFGTMMAESPGRKRFGSTRCTPCDAATIGVGSGDRVRLSTRRGAVLVAVEVSDAMHPGHLALPNGLGLSGPDTTTAGAAPNELTSSDARDPFAGTPHHKYVRARVEVA